MPRLAFRDQWFAPPSVSADLAYSQQAAPDQSENLPLLPPPTNPTPSANTASPPSDDLPTEDSGILMEEPVVDEKPTAPAAEAKKEEKPVVPDLAKGILIATNDGDLTFKPGLRIQPKYIFEQGNDNNDFLIRRFRLKGSGSAYGVAKYGVELKIDNDGRFAVTPSARVENAWLDFPVVEDYAYIRAGLYDGPFSRDALTSDSKLLFMDRTLIKEEVTGVGMADNVIGVMLHGRPYQGHFEYAFGLFDNVTFERFGVAGTRESDQLMPEGRLVWSLLDPMPVPDQYADYMESYIGKGERLELGINAAHMGDVIDGAAIFDLSAWGVDLFYNTGHYTFQTEYDQIIENIAGAADIIADGWYAQAGYLFNTCDPCVEFAIRYQELDPIVGDDTLRWTSIGFNFYIREHNLKVQTDYTFRSDTVGVPLPGGLGLFDEDVFEVQLQLDF
jgi:phosphate-selective porin